jgi:hypothetical protein
MTNMPTPPPDRKSNDRSVVLVEFNELSPPLMERFIAGGHLPNFRRFRDESQVYVTAAEERYPYLDPWIQWASVHSGLNFDKHGIERLNEAHKLKHPYVWDLLSEASFRVWVCGSMSVRYDAGLNGAVLPDPWTTEVKPRPTSLEPFFKFVQQNVLEYSNDKLPLSPGDYARFVAFMMTHGLSRETAWSIARQLTSERVTKAGRWKRATLLDKLQFDVFRWYFQNERPRFSTFFSNSTAHFQHLYWRNMDPEVFQSKPTEAEQKEYKDAILYGYREMDALLGRFMELAGGSATLVFTTAISQQPCLSFEDVGGKHYYRPRDFGRFIAWFALPPGTTHAPVMAHQFFLELPTEEDAKVAQKRIASVRILGQQGIAAERQGRRVMVGCRIWSDVPDDTIVAVEETKATTRFSELFYLVDGVKSGMHHPDGLLWVRRPDRSHRVHEDKVALARIAPTVLDMFSLPAPLHMQGTALSGFRGLVD